MKKVVTIGGGTGQFALLLGLKRQPVDISAIVTMFDSGGSTGRLRDELGVLPPGDVRQCLIALGESGSLMRKLFMHRYSNGGLEGHNFGNLFISTLEKITGSIDKALDAAAIVLNIKGRVIPVSLNKAHIIATLADGATCESEAVLDDCDTVGHGGVVGMTLKPKARAHPKALEAIREADMIVVGPGDLYTSLIPIFLVGGIAEAFRKSRAKKVYIASLMNRHDHASGFDVATYVSMLESFIGEKDAFDVVLYNTKKPPKSLLRKYAGEGEPVPLGKTKGKYKVVKADLLSDGVAKRPKSDKAHRSLIRHEPNKLARALMKILGVKGGRK